MLANAVCFLLGILGCLQLKTVPPPFVLCAAPGCFWLLYRRAAWRWAGFFFLGLLWAIFAAQQSQRERLAPVLEGRTLQLCGVVRSLPRRRGDNTRFDFTVRAARLSATEPGGGFALSPFPAKVRLSWYRGGEEIRAGQQWCLAARLKRPFGMLNPGGFDYETWLFQRGIRATGYVLESRANRKLGEARGWRYQHWRQAIRERLEARQASPLIFALAIGDRDHMARADWEVLQKTGTSHLLAISGLHIGLIAAAAFFLARWSWAWLWAGPWAQRRMRSPSWGARLPAQCFAAAVAAAAALIYAALAGFSLPTQRALVMILSGLAAFLWRRNIGVGDTFGLALLAVLLFDPFAPLAAGFWLSFLAVFTILFVSAYRVNRPRRVALWLLMQWRISLGLLPVLLVLFSRVPSLSVVNNTLAIPWISCLTVPTALLGVAFDMLGLAAVADVLLWLCDLSIAVFRSCMAWLAALPYAQLVAPGVPLSLRLCAVAAVAVLLAPRGLLPGGLSRPALALCLLLPLCVYTPPRPAHGEMFITALDVGQGLAVVVETRRHTLLYDTGPRLSPTFDAGTAVVLPFLRQRGIRRLDRLVLSHGDLDHIGGLRTVLAAVPVAEIDTSVPEKASAPSRRCRAGRSWRWDGVEFAFLHPDTGSFRGNNGSCVLRISTGDMTALLPGDIEARAERRLLATRPEDLAADILLAPHHGSKTSSSPGFIRAVSPRYVVFPVGYRNRFGFPKADILRRYRELGRADAVSLRSYAGGALTFRVVAGGIALQRHREIRRRFWHTTAMP